MGTAHNKEVQFSTSQTNKSFEVGLKGHVSLPSG